MEFLPADYKRPSNSDGYFKLQEGENKIRILSKPIIGWEDWQDNKPVRFRFEDKPLKPIDPKKKIRLFWAFIVWNYAEEKIQIFNVVQATIQSAIEGLSKDKDWGAPYFYDIKITKSGSGINTEYVVNPLPHKPTHDIIQLAFEDRPIYLEALYESLDPFDRKWDTFTPGIFNKTVENEGSKGPEVKKEVISKDQYAELEGLLKACSPKYQADLIKSLQKPEIGAKDLSQLPIGLYDKVKTALVKNAEEFKKQSNNDNLPF